MEVVDDQSLVGIEGLDLRGDDGVHAEIQRLNVNIPSSLETSLNQNLNIVMPVVYLAAKNQTNSIYTLMRVALMGDTALSMQILE